MNSVIPKNLITIQQMIIRKEDINPPSVSPIIVFCKGRQLTSKSILYRDASRSHLKKGHCLYLNSDYKDGPYDKYSMRLNVS